MQIQLTVNCNTCIFNVSSYCCFRYERKIQHTCISDAEESSTSRSLRRNGQSTMEWYRVSCRRTWKTGGRRTISEGNVTRARSGVADLDQNYDRQPRAAESMSLILASRAVMSEVFKTFLFVGRACCIWPYEVIAPRPRWRQLVR